MGNRYKRMVTLGMISFTALLAWGYCMLAYRSQAVYVAIRYLVPSTSSSVPAYLP